MSNITKSKKFRYGASATAITVVVIAAIVILNVIFTALGSINAWYTDITSQNYYKLSDAFKKEFDRITENGSINFNIVVMMNEDRFSTYSYQTVIFYNTVKELTKQYPNIRLKAINSTTYPELVEGYKETYGDTISITDIVIEAADEKFEPLKTINTKKYSINAFFAIDTSGNILGYNAEARFLSAFSQMLDKNVNRPVAFYLTGHGEPSLDTLDATWGEMLDSAGFKAVEIDLTKNDFTEYYDLSAAGDYNNCVLIINSPTRDLYVPAPGDGGVNEVEKIRSFFGTGLGNVIVSVGATTPELPALSQILSEFGLAYGGAVSDPVHSLAGSDSSKVTADYSRMSENMSATMKNNLFGSRSATVPTVFESPANVYALSGDSGSSDTIHGYNGTYGAYALMYPYSSATTKYKDGYDACLLAMYYSTWDVNDDNNTRSYAFIVGSTKFVSESYTNATMNRTVTAWMLSQIYDEMVAFDGISMIIFDDTTTLTITDAQKTAWTIATIVAVPVIAAAAGIYVWIRRRHL